jgi:hypothetical protein
MVFDRRLRLRKPSPEDIEAARKDPEILATMEAFNHASRERLLAASTKNIGRRR